MPLLRPAVDTTPAEWILDAARAGDAPTVLRYRVLHALHLGEYLTGDAFGATLRAGTACRREVVPMSLPARVLTGVAVACSAVAVAVLYSFGAALRAGDSPASVAPAVAAAAVACVVFVAAAFVAVRGAPLVPAALALAGTVAAALLTSDDLQGPGLDVVAMGFLILAAGVGSIVACAPGREPDPDPEPVRTAT